MKYIIRKKKRLQCALLNWNAANRYSYSYKSRFVESAMDTANILFAISRVECLTMCTLQRLICIIRQFFYTVNIKINISPSSMSTFSFTRFSRRFLLVLLALSWYETKTLRHIRAVYFFWSSFSVASWMTCLLN